MPYRSCLRFNAQKDKNHGEIVALLKRRGFSVVDLSRVGSGCPDILVSDSRDMWLAEIKTDTGKFKDSQTKFYAQWGGKPIYVLRSLDDVLKFPCAELLISESKS